MKKILVLFLLLFAVQVQAAGIYTTVARGTVTQANMKISAVDGTAFVDWGYLYQSNFSAGVDGWSAGSGTATGNIDSIGGEDNWLRFTCNNLNAVHRVYNSAALLAGNRYTIQIRYYITAGNSDITSLTVYGGGASAQQRISANGELNTVGSIATYTVTFTNRFAGGISVYANTANVFQDAGGDDTFYIKDITIRQELPVGHLLKIRDSSGRAIQGFIKAAGTGETYNDVMSGWDFTSGWSTAVASIIDANSFSTASGSGGVYKSNITTAGYLYKITYERTTTAGGSTLRFSGAGLVTSPGFIPVSTGVYYYQSITGFPSIYLSHDASAGQTDVISMKVEAVLTPSSTGVTIVSTKGGSTPNFALKNSAFNYNDPSGYTYEIIQVRQLPVIATHSITAGNALIDATEANAFAAPVGVDLSAYQDGQHMLALYDASGYAAIAHISATAPGGETLAAASNVSNCIQWTTRPFDTFDGISATGFHAVKTQNTLTAVAGTADEIVFVAGELWKTVFTATITSGTAPNSSFTSGVDSLTAIGASSVLSVSGANTIYETVASSVTGIRRINLGSLSVSEFTIANLAVTKVLTPSATGVLLLSRKGGSRGWLYKHASFNPNSAITAKILYVGD